MTCIVAIKDKKTGKVHMGADSAASTDDQVIECSDSKIVKKKGILIGIAGYAININVIKFIFEVPKHEDKVSDFSYIMKIFLPAFRKCLEDNNCTEKENGQLSSWSNFLLAYKGSIYTMGSDFCVIQYALPYSVIGSGGDYALGSLYTTENQNLTVKNRCKKALESAAKFSSSVSGPFNYLSV